MSMINFTGKRQLPSILQTEQTECSLACLAMISGYFGHKIDINTMRNKYAVSQHGATLKSIMQTADRMNLSNRALRLELEEMHKLKLPAILHWDMSHFVVLKKVKSKGIVIHDPAVGVRQVDLKDVSKHFTGVALELTPTSEFKRNNENKRLKLHQLWTRAIGMKRNIIQLLLLSLLLEAFAISLPYFMQIVIDDVFLSRDYNLLKIVALGLLCIILIRTITRVLRAYVIMHFSNKMSFQFAANVFRHLIRLPVDYFVKRHIGDIVSRFKSLENIREFLTSGIITVLVDGIMVIGTLTMMFIYSKQLTLVAVILVVLYAVTRGSTYQNLRRKNEELIVAGATENTNFMENIRTIQGIKLFGKETDRTALWQNYFVDVINSGIRVQKLNIFLTNTNGLLVGLGRILIIYLGALAVLDNMFSIGMLIAFISYKDNFLSKSFSLVEKAFEFRLLELHLARLSDIVFTRQEEYLEGPGLPPREICLEGFLEVKNLAFRYSDNLPFLFRNVNLTMEPEETIAIIGPSGCGKSTLIKVLLSLLTPTQGEIKMYGVDINKLGIRHYRSIVGAVMQDDGLLTGSIADNICFNSPSRNQELIELAANLSAIQRDIRAMPMQYNTLVGNMGVALSGGQIQRILIARAIYKNPVLLFLDEATSHLDIETEKMVNKAVRQLKMGRIIVAHRPETIKLADRILQLTPEGLVEISASLFDQRLLNKEQNNIVRI